MGYLNLGSRKPASLMEGLSGEADQNEVGLEDREAAPWGPADVSCT